MKDVFAFILSLPLMLAPTAQATELGAGMVPQKSVESDDPAPAATYDVFIDGVTGYAFVKTPFGWRFVRDLRAEEKPEPAATRR
ncbi:MAG TPA: hypothetical protein VFP70_06890 [Burkholderiales bacterium]|nr:hypothetical protein [Burkholderiales bacterium]